MMFRFRVALAVTVSWCGVLAAQDVDNRNSPIFLERSYIFHRFPPDDLLFEAHLAPHLFFRQGFYQDAGKIYEAPDFAARSWSFSVTPMVRLRMFSTRSNPVRTPSFMPKFNLQFFWASLIDPSLRLDSPIRIVALNAIPWGHHSNGQEGCLYTDQTMDANGSCLDGVLPPGTRRTTNKVNGSFSTNYFRIWGAYRHMRLDDRDPDGQLRANQMCTFTLGVESNPQSFGPGTIPKEQKALYPTMRIISAVELSWREFRQSWLNGRMSGAMQVEYLRTVAPHLSPWTFSAELSRTLQRLGGWGLFLRYYRGMDYYNLGFLDDTRYVHLGLVFDAARSDEFALPPNVAPPRGPSRAPSLTRSLLGGMDRVCDLGR
jgi:hypothetical protein